MDLADFISHNALNTDHISISADEVVDTGFFCSKYELRYYTEDSEYYEWSRERISERYGHDPETRRQRTECIGL